MYILFKLSSTHWSISEWKQLIHKFQENELSVEEIGKYSKIFV